MDERRITSPRDVRVEVLSVYPRDGWLGHNFSGMGHENYFGVNRGFGRRGSIRCHMRSGRESEVRGRRGDLSRAEYVPVHSSQ